MVFKEIFESVKESFCSLWTFKVRGNTLELISPFSTTNFKFISVFITEKENKIIVTDGGWLLNEEYDTVIDQEDDAFQKVFNHYISVYDIKRVTSNNLTYFFKSTESWEQVPTLVYDLCHFLSSTISISQIKFNDLTEEKERIMFSKMADNYIAGLVNKESLSFRQELDEEYKSVKFNAIITKSKEIKLIKYITGSTPHLFIHSVSKASADFQIANNSPYQPYIKSRIALINDGSIGYDSQKVFKYMETLEKHTKTPSLMWSEREKLKSLL